MNTQERFITDIFERVDKILQDEERIKEIVLNGHIDQHRNHHDWVEKQIVNEKESGKSLRYGIRNIIIAIITTFVLFMLGVHANKFFPHLFKSPTQIEGIQ
jgi:hypothetical protein